MARRCRSGRNRQRPQWVGFRHSPRRKWPPPCYPGEAWPLGPLTDCFEEREVRGGISGAGWSCRNAKSTTRWRSLSRLRCSLAGPGDRRTRRSQTGQKRIFTSGSFRVTQLELLPCDSRSRRAKAKFRRSWEKCVRLRTSGGAGCAEFVLSPRTCPTGVLHVAANCSNLSVLSFPS
jgi:hypothetical protein